MLNNIQNLRALAAYGVVVFHCISLYILPTGTIADNFVELPSAGVDLFFVISGFVMVYTTKDVETPGGFMLKRVARIVPLYWAATFVIIAIVLTRSWAYPHANVAPESILASLFFIPHPMLNGGIAPILSAGWTLNFEMYFYALFAVSLMLPRPWRLFGVLSLMTSIWALCQFGGDNRFARFYGDAVVFEFAIGCLIAYALRLPQVANFARATPMWPIALIAAIALIVVTFTLPQTAFRPRNILPIGMLVFAAAAQDMYRKPARETFITKLGDASYSAYLAHTIVMLLVHMVFILVWKDEIRLNMWSFLAVVTVLTAAVSLVLVRTFERPSATFVRNLFRRRASASLTEPAP